VALFGEEVVSGRSTRSSSLIAYLPQHSLGLDELKVSEALRYTAMLRGASRTAAGQQQEQLMERLALTELGDRPLRKLSGGQRRLVHIGMTLAGSLPILILDEPTTDIDPALRQEVWSLLDARRQEGAVIILVTHDVAEAEHVLDRVAILDRGRIVAHGTPAELKGELAQRVRLEVVVAEGSGLDIDDLARDFGGEVRVSGRQLSMWVPADEAVRRLEKVMSASDGFFEDLRLVTPSLEDVYLAAVGHAMEERP
jgi:ABC-2 type transport system ATP-binding protein